MSSSRVSAAVGPALTGPGRLADAVPAAARRLVAPDTHTRQALTDTELSLHSWVNDRRELNSSVDAMLRQLAVALHHCPATVRGIVAGTPSPVHGAERGPLSRIVEKHLRAATSKALDDPGQVRTITYEAVGALADAWRAGSP